jgi:hypothetical protein
MFIRLDIEIWVIVKVALKKLRARNGVGGEGMGDAGFCGPCTCLGVFLLL